MARLRLNGSVDDALGFVTAYLEKMETADTICLEFCEPASRDGMIRFMLTRAEAAGLIGRMAMLLARGHGVDGPATDNVP